MSQVNQMGARLVFANARKALTKAGINATKAKLTQSFLRLEQAISTSKTLYQFPILVNETQLGIFNTENRLNLQDSFVIAQLGLFLAVPSSSTDAAYKLVTNPTSEVFTTSGASAANRVIYNSKLSLTVNNDILIPSWDTLRHLEVPETQFTAATNSPVDQFYGANDGFYPVEPNVTLIGSKNNVLQLELPAAVGTLQANSRIVIVLRGVLAQNSTVVS